jgi:predicted 2-oxoglutarate/Fe(II)-dependent dioxygenase YbiX
MKRPNPAPEKEIRLSGASLSNPPVTIIPQFLDSGMCRRVRAAMDHGEGEPAEILEDGPALVSGARRASIIDVDPATLAAVEARLDAARDVVSARCGVPLGGREGAGFIRYSDGGFYRPHRDRADDAGWPGAAERRIAVVVFLNAGFHGGELVIYPEPPDHDGPTRITPQPGSLVAFDAARLHEVCPVAGGTRDVIVDWFYNPEALRPPTTDVDRQIP